MNRSRLLRAALVAPVMTGALLTVGASNAFADTTVSAKAPVFVDQAGTENDSYIIPDVPGVNYYVDSVKVNTGTRQVNAAKPFVEVFTAAASGYTLSEPATWSHQYKSDNTVEISWNGQKFQTVEDALNAQSGRTATAQPTQTQPSQAQPSQTTVVNTQTNVVKNTTTNVSTQTRVANEAASDACKSTTKRNIPRGDADYSTARDQDGDGIACETGTTATATRTSDELPPTGIEDAVPVGLGILALGGVGGLLLRKGKKDDGAES